MPGWAGVGAQAGTAHGTETGAVATRFRAGQSAAATAATAGAPGGTWDDAEKILLQMISGNVRDRMKPEVMDDMRYYLNVLELDPDQLSVIHVAGTKGKGSTCAIVESILRHASKAPRGPFIPSGLDAALADARRLGDEAAGRRRRVRRLRGGAWGATSVRAWEAAG